MASLQPMSKVPIKRENPVCVCQVFPFWRDSDAMCVFWCLSLWVFVYLSIYENRFSVVFHAVYISHIADPLGSAQSW